MTYIKLRNLIKRKKYKKVVKYFIFRGWKKYIITKYRSKKYSKYI